MLLRNVSFNCLFTDQNFPFSDVGHAMWPAVVVDESCLGNRKGLTKNSEGKSVPVQFFGSHDFARYAAKKLFFS